MLFPDLDEDAIFLSRTYVEEILGTFYEAPFKLDNYEWPTIEHYFQAMKFHEVTDAQFNKVRQAKSAKQAKRYGRSRIAKIRPDWHKVRRVVMTRAVYTSAKTNEALARKLLDTGNRKILENSQYDYYWGCGRDRRAENVYGKVLMDVREKLRQEAEQ